MSISIALSVIACAALLSQWLAWRTQYPSILFLLAAGILLGPVTGTLDAQQIFGDLLFPIISFAVAVILFEGSLTLRLEEIRDYRNVLTRLLTVGLICAWAVGATAAHYFAGFDWALAILFGAIMVVTGPTVVGPMLRSIRPTRSVADILRWEGVAIDPIGAILALLVFEYIVVSQQSQALDVIVTIIVKMIVLGCLVGTVAGYLLGLAIRRYWLPEYLHNVAALLFVLIVFAWCNALQHESGLLAVTIMGLVLANMKNVPLRELLDFKESLSIVLISGLFIILASRLNLESMSALGWGGVAVFMAMQFIGRPLKIWVSSIGSSLTWQERALLSWIAPRGIVAAAISALFALRLETEGYAGAELLVPLAFAIIIGTVLWQGFTAAPLARRLGVSSPEPTGVFIVGGNLVARTISKALHELGVKVLLADSSWDNIRQARMLGLDTYFGDPVSQHAERNLDVADCGYLLALSQRNEVNALCALAFAHQFQRNRIFSLAAGSKSQSERRRTAQSNTGRELFSQDATYAKLASLIAQDAEVHKTKLQESFSEEDLVQKWQGRALPLFALTKDGELMLEVADKSVQYEPGTTLVSLIAAGPGEGAKVADD